MRSEDAQVGKMVVVTTDYREPGLRGMRGVIVGSFGRPEYLALDVQLEDGATELFWHHQLEEVDDEVEVIEDRRSPSFFGLGR